MKKLLAFIIVVTFYLPSFSQDLSLYEKHLFISNGDTLPYRLLLPENYNAAKKYPLVFFMHGSGERGSDNELQLVHGGDLFLKADIRSSFPAIIVFPQCPKNIAWSNVTYGADKDGKRVFNFLTDGAPTKAMTLCIGLLADLQHHYLVQKKQIYAGGLSMGGMGTFELVRRMPKLFAAAIPICGGANPAIARQLKKTNWWIFHGAKDETVPPALSQQMYDALMKEKANVKFTLYPEAGHNSWDDVFKEKELMPWLFAQKRR